MKIENSLWVEKYRPTKLSDYVGNEHIKKVFQKYISENDPKNTLLYGPAGTGKTTLAKLLMANIPCDKLIINASDENNIETIRTRVKQFASSVGVSGYKIILLDEADGITPQAQKALRFLIEEFSSTTRFILTCNYITNITKPLQSRCANKFEVIPPQFEQAVERMMFILDSEKVKYNRKDVELIVQKSFPDLRTCIELLQQNVFDGELIINLKFLSDSNYTNKILNFVLDKKNVEFGTKEFSLIKQILVDSNSNNFNELFDMFYENLEKFPKEAIPSSIDIISELQYYSNFAINKEIPAMTLVCKLFENIR